MTHSPLVLTVTDEWKKPWPSIDQDNEAFWDGLKDHQLLVWKCKDCGAVYWPKAYCQNHDNQPFAANCEWTPASGRGKTVMLGSLDLSVLTLDGWRRILLPASTIALAKAALIIRVTRAATREALPMDYIKFARAKGLSWSRILRVHLLKNILIPIVTVFGLEFGQVVAFAVVTETIFAWPGMGKLLLDSIITLDRPVVVAYLILIVFFLVMLNLVTDILYSVLDPRVRLQTAKA